MGFDNVNVNISGPVQPTSTYKTKVLKGNHSFASQVTETNTKYVIKHNFDLGGESITIPEGCLFEFDGGSISGECTITGANTGIQAGLVKIFNTDVTLAGSWNVTEAYPEWFGANGDGVADDTNSINKCASYFQCVRFASKRYRITDTINFLRDSIVKGNNSRYQYLKGTIIILDSNNDIPAIFINNASNFEISGITIMGKETSPRYRSVGKGIQFGSGSAYYSIKNVSVYYMGIGFDCYNGYGYVLEKCIAKSCRVGCYGNGNSTQINNSVFINGYIGFEGALNGSINSCNFDNNDIGCYIHTIRADASNAFMSINNCTWEFNNYEESVSLPLTTSAIKTNSTVNIVVNNPQSWTPAQPIDRTPLLVEWEGNPLREFPVIINNINFGRKSTSNNQTVLNGWANYKINLTGTVDYACLYINQAIGTEHAHNSIKNSNRAILTEFDAMGIRIVNSLTDIPNFFVGDAIINEVSLRPGSSSNYYLISMYQNENNKCLVAFERDANKMFVGKITSGALKWYLVFNPTTFRGSTRPTLTEADAGYIHFDMTLSPKRPIWWNGTAWVDATGATV